MLSTGKLFSKIKNRFTGNPKELSEEKSSKDTEGNSENREFSEVVKTIISNLQAIDETTAREIMIPRVDIISIHIDTTFQELMDLLDKYPLSRIPVYDKNIDDIKGVLYIKDLFKIIRNNNMLSGKNLDKQVDLKEYIKPAFFTPESTHITTLLNEFLQQKIHLALVVDEYGGTSGLATLEDILEEIVGNIQDEHDNEIDENIITRIGENEFELDGRILIHEVNNQLGTNIPDQQADTLAGFLYYLFGKVPEKDDEKEYVNLLFKVASIEGNRILRIKLKTFDNIKA